MTEIEILARIIHTKNQLVEWKEAEPVISPDDTKQVFRLVFMEAVKELSKIGKPGKEIPNLISAMAHLLDELGPLPHEEEIPPVEKFIRTEPITPGRIIRPDFTRNRK